MALSLVLAAGSASAAGTTTERDRLQCLNTARRDLGRCVKDAQQRCRVEFRGRLPDCLGGPTCPDACTGTFDRCQEPLLVDRDGCRLACQADQKVAMRGCRIAEDKTACRSLVRKKAITCKRRCVRGAEGPLKACSATFSDCLRACALAE